MVIGTIAKETLKNAIKKFSKKIPKSTVLGPKRVQSGPKKKRKLGPKSKAALGTAGVASVATPLMRDGKKSQAETSKPTLSDRRGSMPGPKKKRKLSLDPAVRYSKGFVRDSKGNVIRHKKLTPEQLKERRGNR